MKEEAEKNIIYVNYNEDFVSGGEAINPEEEWSDREDSVYEFNVLGAYSSKNCDGGIYFEPFEVDFDTSKIKEVHVLVVRYSSGDTFGRSTGHGHIEGVYSTVEEAEKIGSAINRGSKSKDYAGYKKLKTNLYLRLPWEGYFESLEGIEIHTFQLSDKIITNNKVISNNIKRFIH